MKKIILLSAVAALAAGAASAAMRFDSLFQDHAVLQQGITIPVWGYGGVPAKAVIDGDTLLVWSPEVKRLVHVLYAWALNPVGANLYNSAGLPAATFHW